jgi:HTH domain.
MTPSEKLQVLAITNEERRDLIAWLADGDITQKVLLLDYVMNRGPADSQLDLAQRLGVSQQAVSKAVVKIERKLAEISGKLNGVVDF